MDPNQRVFRYLFELHKGVAKITINRPEVYNAFRPETNNQMLKQWIFAGAERYRRYRLYWRRRKSFCSGGDQNVKGVGAM